LIVSLRKLQQEAGAVLLTEERRLHLSIPPAKSIHNGLALRSDKDKRAQLLANGESSRENYVTSQVELSARRPKEMRVRSLALIAAVFFSAVNLQAQSGRQKPEPVQQQPQTNPCKGDKEPQAAKPLTVQFSVLVTDMNGPADDVDKADFKIFEDGIQQQLSFFVKRHGPLEYGLLVDTSGSLRAQFKMVIDAARAFVSANAPADEMFLVRFISADKIEMIQEWTSDQALLRKRLDDNLFIEGGESAIVDAVYESANHLFQRLKTERDPRRAGLVLVTDGEDRASYYREAQLMKLVRELNVQVFIIGFTQDLGKGSSWKATRLLMKLAQERGGDALFPSSPADVVAAVERFHQEMSGQYFMGYTSTNQTRDNTRRQIQIEIAAGTAGKKRFTVLPTSFIAVCQ
jgi:Ca-activated chloride channel family protein